MKPLFKKWTFLLLTHTSVLWPQEVITSLGTGVTGYEPSGVGAGN